MRMAEYIERGAVTCRDCYHWGVCDGFGFVLDPIHGGVICDSFVKAADVAPVVRCKDCKHLNSACCGLGTNDFCSYGLRKDGGNG